jgi:hypothetical protein
VAKSSTLPRKIAVCGRYSNQIVVALQYIPKQFKGLSVKYEAINRVDRVEWRGTI